MENDLYSSSQEFQSTCPDNISNSSFKIKEEVSAGNRNINETIKLEYMSYDNYHELSQNTGPLSFSDDESKNLNLFSVGNNFNDNLSSKNGKSSLNSNYNRPGDAGTSRRRQVFKCQYCPKVFCNSSAIAKHKLTHSDERKYACDICGKAFKRQDHLNGHKHTHKANKPHACHFCDRSYSDARSLKRHYENQHQKEYKEKMATRDSGSSLDDNGPLVIDAFGFFEDHKSVKCEVCSRGFKNQSALNGHMRLHGGYGQAKNSISGPGEPKLSMLLADNSADKSTDLLVSPEKQMPSLKRQPANLILVTSMQDNNSERPVHSLISLIPSSSNSSINFSTHCKSVSSRLHNSRIFTNSPKYDQSLSPGTHVVMDSNNLPNVSIEDLSLVFPPTSVQDRIRDPRSISSTSEKSSSPIELSTDGISYSLSTTKQPSSNADLSQNQYSPITPAYPTKHGQRNLDGSTLFTYPSHLDNQQISDQSYNERDLSYENNHSDDYLLNYDRFSNRFITSASNSAQKSWPFYDISTNSQGTPEYNHSDPPSLKKISSANNIQDILMNLDNLSDSNDITINSDPPTIEESIWQHYHDDNPNINMPNEFINIVKKEEDTILNKMESVICPLPIVTEDHVNNPVQKPHVAETQQVVPPNRRKPRPAPIFIPPQTSAHMSRLRSPRVWNTSESTEQKIPPYTPPPMLSPQRRGSGLFNTVRYSSVKNSVNSANSFYSVNTPFSTKTITAVSNNCCSDSVASSIGNQQISSVFIQEYPIEGQIYRFEKTIEPQHFIYQDEYLDTKTHSFEDKDGLPTSATPRINIGPEYQVELTNYCPAQRPRNYQRVYDTLLWNPRHFKETLENISSLNLLMKIASSPAVKSCGLNMEYTFHLLFKYQGDLEKTLQTLLEDSFVVYDYVYAETSNWTTEEIGKFQERLKAHDRDFMRVSLDLQNNGMNKSVKACVEFYYVWKRMNNAKDVSLYRLKSRKRLPTRNNSPPPEDDIDQSIEVGYNLRNPKLPKPHPYYVSRASSGSSSREPSPCHTKGPRNSSVLPQESAKKSRLPYQCSQCNKTFVKLKTFENHNRNYVHNKGSRNKIPSRIIDRAAESTRY